MDDVQLPSLTSVALQRQFTIAHGVQITALPPGRDKEVPCATSVNDPIIADVDNDFTKALHQFANKRLGRCHTPIKPIARIRSYLHFSPFALLCAPKQ